MNDSEADYFKYWGKTDRDDPAKYHLLPFHCLDVAAVGWVFPTCVGMNRGIRGTSIGILVYKEIKT